MDTFGEHKVGPSAASVKGLAAHCIQCAARCVSVHEPPADPAMRSLLLPCLLLLAAAALPAGAAVLRVEGEALPPKGGRALYRETHYLQDVGAQQARLVLYRCNDGRPFARKWMPAAANAQAPDFEFVDGRDGRREAVQAQGTQRRVSIRAASGAADAAKTLQMPGGGVIDAGFDAAVRAHWSTLLQGDTVALPFLLTSRQRWVPVKLRRVGAVDWQGQPAEQLQMQLDAWFGFAVPAVNLVYARADRRLLQFEGTGNVRDADGGWPQVRIRFPGAPRPVSEGELSAARTQPLVASCTR